MATEHTTRQADAYVVIGNPIAHSLSPWIHHRFAQLTEQNIQYNHCLAPLEGFAATIQRLQQEGVKGCNVTVPFKLQAAELATHSSTRVQLAQAANTLRFADDGSICADNTDGLGLVRDIEHNAGFTLAGKRILLLGAGGAAAGALASLIAARPQRITVVNRTTGRAETLVHQHQTLAEEHSVSLHANTLSALVNLPTVDALINATASSLQGDSLSLPSPSQMLAPHALVYDMMYGPAAQAFLQWATSAAPEHPIKARDGLGMLVEQAAEAFMIWRGVRPNSAKVLPELRQHLANRP